MSTVVLEPAGSGRDRPADRPHVPPIAVRGPLRAAVANSLTLSGRSLRQLSRKVDALLTSIILPVVILLMFVFVFGGAIDTGVDYINYVIPGILLLCAGFGSAMTATTVNADMTGGMVDRLRTMPIASGAVVVGHVVASLARNAVSTAIVIGIAIAVGFRPTGGVLDWLAAVGLIGLFVLAISALAAMIGLVAPSPEAADGFGFAILFLPYVSSAFVPPDTMPAFLQGFAEHQPVTPVIETLRGLLMGTPIGSSAWLAVAWCVGILVVSVAAAAVAFRRRGRR